MSDDIPLERRRRLSVTEYHRMVEVGVLAEGERVELLAGFLVQKAPQTVEHARPVTRLTWLLTRGLSEAWRVQVQQPLTFGNDSEPEPDLAVITEAAERGDTHPDWARLVVEVAVSSGAIDRGLKAELYARADIPEYWVVDPAAQRVEVLTRPDARAARYQDARTVGPGEQLEVEGVAVDVAALFHAGP